MYWMYYAGFPREENFARPFALWQETRKERQRSWHEVAQECTWNEFILVSDFLQ